MLHQQPHNNHNKNHLKNRYLVHCVRQHFIKSGTEGVHNKQPQIKYSFGEFPLSDADAHEHE